MVTYVALLRGINVGGNKRIKMADLRTLLAAIGCDNPQTLLASGNVVFDHPAEAMPKLTETLATAIAETYDFEVPIILRTAAAWTALIENNPFAGRADVAGNRLLAFCLSAEPTDSAFSDFLAAHTTREEIQRVQDVIYIHYPDGMGKSKLTNAVLDKALDVVSTGRNWNTVEKIGHLLASR